MDIKALLKIALGKAVTPEQLDAIKADIVKMEAQLGVPAPMPAIPAPAQFKEMKTKDGKVLTVEGDLKEAAPIMIVSETGPSPATDGDYELEDGTVISVSGGIIKAINPVVVPAPMPAEMTIQMAAHKKEIESFETKLSAQKTEFETKVSELTKISLANSKILDAILEAPVDTILLAKQKEFKDMTALEKYRELRAAEK